MELCDLRNLIEQEATATTTAASTGTDSGDIATYPYPLFWAPSPSTPKLFAPNVSVLRSNQFMGDRKKGKRRKVRECMDYTPWDDKLDKSISVTLEYLARAIEKKLAPMGFRIVAQENGIDAISASGRIFEYKIVEDYLTLVEGRTDVTIDRQVGISANRPLFMAFPIPKGQSSNNIWKIAESSWWMILKYDMFLEVAPFVDYSGLSDKETSDLNEHFILIPKNKFRGTFDHWGFYQKTFAENSGINESRSFDLDHFKPINKWEAKFAEYDLQDFYDAVADVEKFGTKPVRNGLDLYWNDDLRIRFSPNGIGIVEVAGNGHWYAIHSVPILPKEYIDEYADELRIFVEKYEKPTSFNGSWNMPDIIWKIWEANAGDPSYNSGIAFHKDGIWGIDYTVSAMGRGTSDASVIEAPYIQYRMRVLEEGLHIRSEQIIREGQTYKIAPCDLNVLFYEGFPVKEIIRFVGRFTFSS